MSGDLLAEAQQAREREREADRALLAEVVAAYLDREQERDFYRALLDLGGCADLEPFVADVLALIVQMSRCSKGYIELYDDHGAQPEPLLTISQGHAPEQEATFRATISQGVITEAITTRTTVLAVPLEDPRFRDRGSVRQRHNIEAVLCTPLGSDPPLGVLYLQDRAAPGPFTAEDVARAEMFARHLAPLTERLLVRRRLRQLEDPTAPFRSKLVVDGVVGRSPALARLLEEVTLIAGLDVAVLLAGETGTGKTQIARVIHQNSPRRGGPFVEVNCATIQDGLAVSDLFGSLAGSHSTATRRTEGKVDACCSSRSACGTAAPAPPPSWR